MHQSPSREYFHNIWQTIRTILIGMRVSLKYCFAKTVTVQYPDVTPTLQPRYRGFHFYEIEKCIACDMCAKACPVDCIYITGWLSQSHLPKEDHAKGGRRRLDKERGLAVGGPITRYAIDYAKCMFCGLCTVPCPTGCIHMGNIHDLSAYTREDMIVEFTELAKQGLQTPQPLWMLKDKLPEWARKRKAEWLAYAHSDDKLTGKTEERRAAMLMAMEDTTPPPKEKKPKEVEK